MRPLAWLRSLWRNLVHRDRVEAALDEELRAYVDLLAAEYERSGLPPALARRQALVDSGGIEQVKEATRDAWVGDALATAARELRYALRTLRRSPAFLAISIATLAIGIGGATAVFTVVNAALLRPLPGVAEPEQLVTVERLQGTRQIAEFSYPDYFDLREHARTLAGLAAYNGTSMRLDDSAGTGRAWVSFVSDDFFTVLGVRPAAGRLFGPGDTSVTEAASGQVVVLGHALWQSRFGGSASAIGSTLKLDGHVFTIIGVAPPGFIGAMAAHPMELWIPLGSGGRLSPVLAAGGLDLTSRRDASPRLVGRLAPGRNVDEARRELAGIAARLEAAYPTNRGRSVQVFPGAGMTAEERTELSRVPRLLAMAVGLLLLIACSSVAGLSLVRAAARRRELATRLALGASRAVLVRQVVLEGAVVAAGAGLLGVAVARALVRSATLVRSVVPMRGLDVDADARVLGVALAAAALTAVLVSLLPAIQLFRVPPGAVLKDGGGGALRRRSGQRALVAAQMGASLVLLAAAAIVYGALHRVLTVHDELEPGGLTYVSLDADRSAPDSGRLLAFYRAVLARAASEPGITGATITSSIPPLAWSARATIFRAGEEPPREALVGRELELGVRVNAIVASPDFFDVLRIPLLRGRAFTARDDARGERVAIVSRRLAEGLWPGREAVGQLLAWPSVEGPPRPPLRVVGVAADTRDLALTANPPLALYLPLAQHPSRVHVLVVRTHGGVPVARSALHALVAAVDPDVAVLGGKTLRDELRDQLRPQRTASAWIGVFGAIALLLASIGLYGIVAEGVLQRTRELALRSALGASPGRILANVLGDGMRLVAIGAVVGGLGALAAFRVVRTFFSGVQAVDVRSTVVAVALLLMATIAAAWLPARRATRLNPADALRCD